MKEINDKEKELMLHATGHNSDEDTCYRNYFYEYAECPVWESLVKRGLATKHFPKINNGSDIIYQVTKEGFDILKELEYEKNHKKELEDKELEELLK